ncbi:stressosome-associated protein Prli42 [Lysinibacillus sphaericus]
MNKKWRKRIVISILVFFILSTFLTTISQYMV